MRKLTFALPVSMFAVVLGCSDGGAGGSGPVPGAGHIPVCEDPGPGQARCHAHVVVDPSGKPAASSSPSGYSPADLQAAYNVKGSAGGAGQTVAIVDAYDDPTAESDLNYYRSYFGLPAVPSFTKVNQNGVAGSYPKANSSWSQEIAIDVEMVSAICPNCNILLVEANSASSADLATAVNTAARLGANAISNSYGSSETSSVTTYAADYDHPGIAITVSSGDSGYGVQSPADYATVTAVGGTSLTKASNARGWTETAWSGAGSGCSTVIAKPSWQKDSGCSKRTVADVSAVADPNTGVAIWVSSHHGGSWLQFGGTSVASPIIAAMYALAGNASSLTGSADGASLPYGHTSSLNDVTSGSNGSCGGSYLCTAASGYDGPTGLGTPNGSGAF